MQLDRMMKKQEELSFNTVNGKRVHATGGACNKKIDKLAEALADGFNTVNGKRVLATQLTVFMTGTLFRFNTVNGKRVHATLSKKYCAMASLMFQYRKR